MLDRVVRPLIDPPLNAAARLFARTGLTANAASVLGAAAGVGAGVAIAYQRFGPALGLIALSRLLDGIDGALARLNGKTPFGAYLDSVCDYVFYAAVPLGFAVANAAWTLPAAVLLASFLLSGASFLAFAAVAAERRLATNAQGDKGLYYLAGLAEGTETIAMFVTACLIPSSFPLLALGFAALCALTALVRLLAAHKLLRTTD